MSTKLHFASTLTVLLFSSISVANATAQTAISPSTMPKVATVDPRFLSYNIEMVEVTGGRFWAPYTAKTAAAEPPSAAASAPAGMDPSLYRYRQPIDLASPRLRTLAAALGPAYVRVSGTWANYTFFQNSDAPAPPQPPEGFGNVLTRAQWRGVIDFAHATDSKIVSSFAISAGVRDAQGVWTPREARPFLDFTKSAGGEIAAAEMFNEPTFAAIGGAPKGYDDAAYGRDFRVFAPFIKAAAPGMKILGPGSIGEAGSFGNIPGNTPLHTAAMIAAEGPGLDVFSYHFYGGASKRCAVLGAPAQTVAANALTDQWLDRTNRDYAFYSDLRDKSAPGLPIWLTETAETACGGNPWASDFIDTFRFLNQFAYLARQGVQVVAHNTLAASDYGLIDEATLTPRPNYWAAVLWRRLMGVSVLDSGIPNANGLRVYAQCQRDQPGGVTLLVLNTDRTHTAKLAIPSTSARYTLTADDLMDNKVKLNGHLLELTTDGKLPTVTGIPTPAGSASFAPASVTFLTLPRAQNSACLAKAN